MCNTCDHRHNKPGQCLKTDPNSLIIDGVHVCHEDKSKPCAGQIRDNKLVELGLASYNGIQIEVFK